jgi:hypothetical protein
MTRWRAILCLAVVLGCISFVPVESAPAPRTPGGFTVHEWGTFSTFSGSDGVFLKFQPNDQDLPPFVQNIRHRIKGGLPDVYVSLETPVIYFYSDREMTASVDVRFPKGMLTEWYPDTTRPPFEGLSWKDITILPRGQVVPLERKGQSRYYAARETDACPVRVNLEKGKTQHEKFLFYRGVAKSTMPLSVRALGNGSYVVKNTGKESLPGFIAVQVHDGKVRFQSYGTLAGGAEVRAQETQEESSADKLGAAVAKMLIAAGLYEKEARAMVKTWRPDWFEEDGTRFLYPVPEVLTNQLLPLQITPKPDSLVRVLIGRHDVLTPEKERAIDVLVRKLGGGSNEDARVADATLKKLGRYRSAVQGAASARLKTKPAPGGE